MPWFRRRSRSSSTILRFRTLRGTRLHGRFGLVSLSWAERDYLMTDLLSVARSCQDALPKSSVALESQLDDRASQT